MIGSFEWVGQSYGRRLPPRYHKPSHFVLKIRAPNGDNEFERPKRNGSRQSRTSFSIGEQAEPKFQGGNSDMNRKEIIFFDELGFGWIVEKSIIQKIHGGNPDEDTIVEKTLADLLRCA